MKLELKRFCHGEEDSLGLLFVDGTFACFTLEDEYRAVKVMGETRIPEGTYALGLRFSPKFSPIYGHSMLFLKSVPGFEPETVLIHRGNDAGDTRGCLLVANAVHYNPDGPSQVLQSRVAYDRLYPIVSKAVNEEGAYIEVTRL